MKMMQQQRRADRAGLLWYLGRVALALLCFTAGVGCAEERSAEDLFAERASGVVLVRSYRYFRVTVPSVGTYYFSRIDKISGGQYRIQDWTTEVEHVGITVFCSGFFVSADGEILTSRDAAMADASISDLNLAVQEELLGEIQELDEELFMHEETEREVRARLEHEDVSPTERSTLEHELREAVQGQRRLGARLQTLRSNKDGYEIELVSNLGIAYTGGEEDPVTYTACRVVDVNRDDAFDLSLIQLQSKKTPSGRYIFDLDDHLHWEDIRVGTKAYMIGFNEGLELARTGRGLQPQITSGEVSRDPNPACVLYTTPTMPGSSGSPIMDGRGRLLALNYGGMPEENSFNYGIAMSAAQAYYLRVKEEGAEEFRIIPRRLSVAEEPEELSLHAAERLLQTYYSGLEYEDIKSAVRAFSPYRVQRYHRLEGTNRAAIAAEIERYIKQYRVDGVTIKSVERVSKTDFRYTLELRLTRRSDEASLHYAISGRMGCIYEEGDTFIWEVEDVEQRRLTEAPRP